jgi:hypothetical protein
MKTVRRVLITLAVTFTVLFIGIYWIAPVALSFYSSEKALAITRVVPVDLKDDSVYTGLGNRVSYLGYEFEVPWNDLDESKTELFPKDKPNKTVVRLHFRSGLQIVAIAGQPHSFADQFTKTEWKMSPEAFAAVFGHNAPTSDYEFMKRVLDFSPDKMHHWAFSPALHAREEVLLLTKSVLPTSFATTGIFRIRNATYRGFQQGNPGTRQQAVLIDLYSSSDSFEIVFLQKNDTDLTGITQPEINRVVQSLHKISPASPIAER